MLFSFYQQVMGFGLFLLNNRDVSIYKLEKKQRLNLGKIDKFFKVNVFQHCTFSTFVLSKLPV